MEDIENLLKEIDEEVKKRLSEKRYIHSVGVMKKAEQLARKYGIDPKKAKLVGLAHDIAKEMNEGEILQYVQEHHIIVDEYERENLGLLHGKIGADFCRYKYDFSEDMQKAIEYHVTGNPNMDDLAKIILVADKTEEGRTYIDFKKVAEKEEQGLNEILTYVLDLSIIQIIEKRKKMHPTTVITRNNFLL